MLIRVIDKYYVYVVGNWLNLNKLEYGLLKVSVYIYVFCKMLFSWNNESKFVENYELKKKLSKKYYKIFEWKNWRKYFY